MKRIRKLTTELSGAEIRSMYELYKSIFSKREELKILDLDSWETRIKGKYYNELSQNAQLFNSDGQIEGYAIFTNPCNVNGEDWMKIRLTAHSGGPKSFGEILSSFKKDFPNVNAFSEVNSKYSRTLLHLLKKYDINLIEDKGKLENLLTVFWGGKDFSISSTDIGPLVVTQKSFCDNYSAYCVSNS